MASKRMQFRHLFGGGWATDFGPSADVGPNQMGDVILPWLNTARNVYFELDGGPHKIGGTSKLNSSVIASGAAIRGIFDFWIQGAARAPTQKRLVYASTQIFADAADGTFSSIKTGLTDNAVPCITVFNDAAILSSDSLADVPMIYDGTTVSTLAGTPPSFAFSKVHKNKLWAAGDPLNPSRLYYSRTLNANSATSWSTSVSPDATAGSIDIDPNDGDVITGIESHKNDLWVFKGPYKGSIHRITGSANTGTDSFARIPFVSGIGGVSHNTLFKFRDDLGFMWSDCTIHSLAATAAYGDFNESALSRPIHRYFREHVNFAQLKRAWAATHVSRSTVAFAIPVDTSTHPNQIIAFDYSRQQVWWQEWPALDAACISRVIDSSQSNQPILMIGGKDGFVRKTEAANRAIDSATAISARVDTPYTNYGSAIVTKTLENGSVGLSPKGAYTATFGWTRDNNAQQTTTLTQGGSDVLGPAAANQFTLDTSTLGGSQYVDRFFEAETGGEFRSISYSITNAGLNEDLEVHSFSVGLAPGAQSTETTL